MGSAGRSGRDDPGSLGRARGRRRQRDRRAPLGLRRLPPEARSRAAGSSVAHCRVRSGHRHVRGGKPARGNTGRPRRGLRTGTPWRRLSRAHQAPRAGRPWVARRARGGSSRRNHPNSRRGGPRDRSARRARDRGGHPGGPGPRGRARSRGRARCRRPRSSRSSAPRCDGDGVAEAGALSSEVDSVGGGSDAVRAGRVDWVPSQAASSSAIGSSAATAEASSADDSAA